MNAELRVDGTAKRLTNAAIAIWTTDSGSWKSWRTNQPLEPRPRVHLRWPNQVAVPARTEWDLGTNLCGLSSGNCSGRLTPAGREKFVNNNRPVQQNWTDLQPGERVIVYLDERRNFLATIESKTENSSVVWVLPDGDSRRAYHYREGVFMMRDSGHPVSEP